MSVFLTPDRKPLYADIYFGPEDRTGRPGVPTVADPMHNTGQSLLAPPPAMARAGSM